MKSWIDLFGVTDLIAMQIGESAIYCTPSLWWVCISDPPRLGQGLRRILQPDSCGDD